jgi:hypothetical protein
VRRHVGRDRMAVPGGHADTGREAAVQP